MPGQRYRVVHRTEYVYGATMLDGYSVACVLARPTPSQTVASSVVTTYPEPDEYDERARRVRQSRRPVRAAPTP